MMSRLAISRNQQLVLAVLLTAFVVLSRLLPHLPNFTPVTAVAVLGGTLMPKRWALLLPLTAMVVSDILIGLHPLVLCTWGSFGLIALLAGRARQRASLGSLMLLGVSGSVLFYIITNFGVWLQGQMYKVNVSGLLSCYYHALPFFRNMLAGDILYIGFFYAAFRAVLVITKTRAAEPSNH